MTRVVAVSDSGDKGDEDDGLGDLPKDCENCFRGSVDLEHLGWCWCHCAAGRWQKERQKRQRRAP